MPKQQSKYCKQWESPRSWLKPGSNKYLGRCIFCNKEFQVGRTGLIQVGSHARSDGDKAKIPGNFLRLCIPLQVDSLALQLRMKSNCPAMQGLHAEIIETFQKIEYDQSFGSATNDGDRFRLMFQNYPA